MKALQFMRTALKDYRVGAVSVSSRYTIEKIIKHVGGTRRYLVEYGPGEGTLTKALLEQVASHGKLVGIETNKDLLDACVRRVRDARFVPIHGDVRKLAGDLPTLGVPEMNAVVSGIPFSFLSPKEREAIVKKTYRALSPGGVFVVYQYSPLMYPVIKKYFPRTHITFEPRNVFPYFIMTGEA